MGKTGRKNKNYSPEFKIGVIMDMREHRLGYCETVRKYGLGPVETGVARFLILWNNMKWGWHKFDVDCFIFVKFMRFCLTVRPKIYIMYGEVV